MVVSCGLLVCPGYQDQGHESSGSSNIFMNAFINWWLGCASSTIG